MKTNENAKDCKQKEYVYLHILRVFACLWVLAVHWEQRVELPGVLHKLCAAGSSGVVIFFVLSGFLAFPSLEREMARHPDWRANVSWLWKRAVRLLPLYYVMILFQFIFYTVIGGVPIDETGLGWFRYLLLINYCVPSSEVFWTNVGAVWTISVFAVYYLITPIYHKMIKNYRIAWLGLTVTYVLARVLGHYTDWFRLLQYLYYYAVGVIAYMAIKEKREHQMIAVLSAILLLLLVIESQGGLKLALLVAIFIVATGNQTLPQGVVRRMIETISEYSYSIYLVHAAVLGVLDYFRIESAVVFTIVSLVMTMLFSFVSYQFIEKRVGRFLATRIKLGKHGSAD